MTTFIVLATLAALFTIGVVGVMLYELIGLAPTRSVKRTITACFWVYVVVGFCCGHWLVAMADRMLPGAM